jgi:fructokinase
MSAPLYGLVEAGGTKFVLGIATGNDDIRSVTRIPTTTPSETISAVCEWFAAHGPLAGIGVASFGPLDLDPVSPTWGSITATPKPHWSNCDLVGPLKSAFNCPVHINTDVGAAAMAEYRWGAGQGHKVMLYFTIGTGIGGGAIVDGAIVQGLSHPEMGHIRLPRHRDDQAFPGVCPFHGDCLEGLASGPAITARWGASLSDLSADHPAHDIIAWYLAHTIVTTQAMFQPGKIIMGGGVMTTPGLIDRVRLQASALGNAYFPGDVRNIVGPPGLGDHAGLLGALALLSG